MPVEAQEKHKYKTNPPGAEAFPCYVGSAETCTDRRRRFMVVIWTGGEHLCE